VIYDSTYTDEEYPRFAGWGHSTWQEGVRLAEVAEVKKLVIFHHDPGHDDTVMDRIAEAAEKARPGTVVAREGLTLRP
jgi:ribonuclease BN (tRNA processing enzyme)